MFTTPVNPDQLEMKSHSILYVGPETSPIMHQGANYLPASMKELPKRDSYLSTTSYALHAAMAMTAMSIFILLALIEKATRGVIEGLKKTVDLVLTPKQKEDIANKAQVAGASASQIAADFIKRNFLPLFRKA